jgi:hypothetical protein
MGQKYIAMCGLDCAKCEAFIATQNNDDAMRQKAAGEWNARYKQKGYDRPELKAQDINCRGCLSDGPIYLYCQQCKIRQCGLSRGFKNCQECSGYKCPDLVEKQSHFY